MNVAKGGAKVVMFRIQSVIEAHPSPQRDQTNCHTTKRVGHHQISRTTNRPFI